MIAILPSHYCVSYSVEYQPTSEKKKNEKNLAVEWKNYKNSVKQVICPSLFANGFNYETKKISSNY